jgi:glycosyltransferase involved in cell wall biosynthesis
VDDAGIDRQPIVVEYDRCSSECLEYRTRSSSYREAEVVASGVGVLIYPALPLDHHRQLIKIINTIRFQCVLPD